MLSGGLAFPLVHAIFIKKAASQQPSVGILQLSKGTALAGVFSVFTSEFPSAPREPQAQHDPEMCSK